MPRNLSDIMPKPPKLCHLFVEVVGNVPASAERTARDMRKQLEDALFLLGYFGQWRIKILQRAKSKSGKWLKLTRIEQVSLVGRMKTGDNSTCWDVRITPPSEYDLNFLQKDLSSLKHIEPKMVSSFLKGLYDLQKKPEQQETHYLGRPELPKPKEPEPKKIAEDEEKLDIALMAIYVAAGDVGKKLGNAIGEEKEKSVLREQAYEVINDELNLEKMVDENPLYDTPNGLFRAIIKALRDRGDIVTWAPVTTPGKRTNIKGYIVTNAGFERISRPAGPERAPVEEPEETPKEEIADPAPTQSVKPEETTQFEQLSTVVEPHDSDVVESLTSSIDRHMDFLEKVDRAIKSFADTRRELAGKQKSLEKRKEELDNAQKLVESLSSTVDEIKAEIVKLENETATKEQELERIQKNILT